MVRQRALFALCFGILLLGGFPVTAGVRTPAAARQAEPTATAGFDREAFGPSSQQLIAAQLEAGELDYPTSLLYRAYALVGDERLPAELAVAGPLDLDRSVFAEMRRLYDSVPPAMRAQFDPFLVRPTDPRSIYAREGDGRDRGPAANLAAPGTGGLACTAGWASRLGASPPGAYKVWAACTGDYEADIDRAMAVLDAVWTPAVDLMGPPHPDDGSDAAGGDPAIDVYLVDPGETVPGRGVAGVERALAYVLPAAPVVGNGSSAFMVVWRDQIASPDFRSTLVHEFFHILQNAHNTEISFGWIGTPYTPEWDLLIHAEGWWVEATAEWAAAYLERGVPGGQVGVVGIHGRFISDFQTLDESLHAAFRPNEPAFLHIYAAYIWFLFMEQEVGPEAIVEIWEEMGTLDDPDFDAAMAIIDAALPFETHFRDFAVRNLNLDLQPGDPITPSYHDLDPLFPEGIRPPLVVGEGREALIEAPADGAPQRFPARVKSLSARYYYFRPGDEVGRLTLDFAGLGPSPALDVDVIAQVEGRGWERRRLDPTTATTFCLTESDEELTAFYLILSNHDRQLATTIAGDLTIRAEQSPCAADGT